MPGRSLTVVKQLTTSFDHLSSVQRLISVSFSLPDISAMPACIAGGALAFICSEKLSIPLPIALAQSGADLLHAAVVRTSATTRCFMAGSLLHSIKTSENAKAPHAGPLV